MRMLMYRHRNLPSSYGYQPANHGAFLRNRILLVWLLKRSAFVFHRPLWPSLPVQRGENTGVCTPSTVMPKTLGEKFRETSYGQRNADVMAGFEARDSSLNPVAYDLPEKFT